MGAMSMRPWYKIVPGGADARRSAIGVGEGAVLTAAVVAEVDGNRTRRTGIARPTRFEGGGAHQALRHLRWAG